MAPACPRCPNSPLSTSSTHGVWVMYCSRCWGMWVDDASVRHVAQAAIAEASTVHGEALPCAICRAPMTAWHARGVVVDRCDAHGVWFDRAELDHLVAAAAAPTTPARSGVGTAALAVGGVAVAAGAAMLVSNEEVQRRASTDGSGGLEVAETSVDVVHAALPVADVAGDLASGAADAASSAIEGGGELAAGAAEAVAESAGGVVEALGDAVSAVFSIFS